MKYEYLKHWKNVQIVYVSVLSPVAVASQTQVAFMIPIYYSTIYTLGDNDTNKILFYVITPLLNAVVKTNYSYPFL